MSADEGRNRVISEAEVQERSGLPRRAPSKGAPVRKGMGPKIIPPKPWPPGKPPGGKLPSDS